MRSLKKNYDIVAGCVMVPGKMYLLKFGNRCNNIDYIFEYDSIETWFGGIRLMHRNNWDCDGIKYTCNGVECLVTLPSSEEIKITRYRGKIDWDM